MEREICHYKRLAAAVNMFSMRKSHIFNLSIFRGMDKEQQEIFLPLIELCHIAEGKTIFKQGDPANCLYILESGIIEIVYKPFDGPDLSVSRITNGGVFGWSSMMGRERYTSGAMAVVDCEAYRICGKDLHILCEKYPETGVVILDRLASAIAERLEGTHKVIMDILNQGMEMQGKINFEGAKNG